MRVFEEFKTSQLFKSHWNVAKSLLIKIFLSKDNFIYK